MNVTTVRTTDMDPIVFANTFNAAQKLANTHQFTLEFNRDVRTYELVSQVSGRVWATFGDVVEAERWMSQHWASDMTPTSTHGPDWA